MIRLEALSIGPIAAEILREQGEVEVHAGFERGFYLIAREGLICVASPEFGNGPVNVLVPLGTGRSSALIGLSLETKGRVRDGQLFVGDDLCIGLGAADAWMPAPWPRWEASTVANGIAALDALAATQLPNDGLAAAAFAPQAEARTPIAAAALDQIRALDAGVASGRFMGAVDAATTRAAMLLIGMGHGFTAAGDNLLCGVLLGLTALGREQARDTIWAAIEPELSELTTEVSAMQVAAAADGLGAASVHDIANTVLKNDAAALPALLDALPASCHGAGWDTLGGLVLVWRAALRDAAPS